MATSGGGSSLSTSSAYGNGGGGVGGKFQKRSFIKSRPTPYDRPRTSLQNPNWVSKLFLDPASKLLAASARRFFSSIFRERLPPPSTSLLLPPSAENPEMSNGLQDPHIPKHSEAVQTAAAADSQSLIREDSCGISELEQRLKQKTLTRHEIDRLTELLQSKAVDLPVTNDIKRDASSPLKPVKLKDFWLENTRGREGPHQISLTPGTSARGLEEDITTPVELAITYVGSRPSKESSSPMSFHGQTIHGNGNLLSNIPSSPSSNVTSLEMTTTGQVDVQKNGFPIPRFHGRSAIYRMAGTSYMRKHQTTSGKANDCNGNLLTSLKQDGEPLWKETGRKRSSAVLDDDVGSVGPIRRTRGRHGPVSYKASFPFGGKYVSNGATPDEDVEDANVASTSYHHVPPESRETMSKISLNDEKMKQKEESETKLIIDREKSPSKSTLKLLEGIQNGEKLDDLSQGNSTGIDGYYSEKQKRVEENHLNFFNRQHDMTLMADNDSTVSAEHKLSSSVPPAQLTKKKHGFMMSVHEDFFDLDEDTHCNGSAAADSFVEVREEHTTDGDERNSTAGNSILDKTPGFFETRKKTNVDLVTVPENTSAGVGGSVTSFAFPTLSLPEKPLQSVVHGSSSSLENLNYVKGSFASVSEVTTPKFSSWTESIPSSSNRPSGAVNTSLRVSGSAEHEENNLQEVVKGKEKSETQNSVPFGSSISTSISASTQPELSSINNGPSTNIFTPTPPHTFATSSSQTLQFGFSDKTSTAVSLLSNPEPLNFKSEADKPPNVIGASFSSPFDSIPTPPQSNQSSSFFGLDSRIDSSVKSQSQVADVSEKTPSLFSSSTLTSTAPLNSSIPVTTNMFGAVSSFGTSGTNNSSSSSIFTSNSTASTGLNNIFSFGSGSAPVINTLNNVATTSNPMPSIVTFGSTMFNSSSSSSSVFSFGASSSPSTGSMVFGAASTPVSSFPTASTSPSPFTSFPSPLTASPNNDQMNTEDMAEDPVQSQPIGVFGQQSVVVASSQLPLPGFSFGSVISPALSGFQLGGGGGNQQSQSPLIQGPGSFEINHGGNFSLGSAGGDDKSSRRFVKVNKNRHRKNGQRN